MDSLYLKYKQILNELSQIDAKIIWETDHGKLLALIEQRKPIHARLEEVYQQILNEEKK